jgi:hypothetical protein
MSNQENTYYVYVHRKLSDNSIFYVGKGCNGRYKDTNGRNLEWWSVVFKENGFQPSIYQCDLTEEDALKEENRLIKELDGLVNILYNQKGESSLNIGDVQYEPECTGKIISFSKCNETGIAKLKAGRVPNFMEMCKEYIKLKKKKKLSVEELENTKVIESAYPCISDAYKEIGENVFTRTRYSKKKIEAELLKLQGVKDPNVIRKLLNLEIGKKYSLEELKTKILSLPVDYQPAKKTASSILQFYNSREVKIKKGGKQSRGYIILGVK